MTRLLVRLGASLSVVDNDNNTGKHAYTVCRYVCVYVCNVCAYI